MASSVPIDNIQEKHSCSKLSSCGDLENLFKKLCIYLQYKTGENPGMHATLLHDKSKEKKIFFLNGYPKSFVHRILDNCVWMLGFRYY